MQFCTHFSFHEYMNFNIIFHIRGKGGGKYDSWSFKSHQRRCLSQYCVRPPMGCEEVN